MPSSKGPSSKGPRTDALLLYRRLAWFLPLIAVPMLANWIFLQSPVQSWMVRGFHDVAGALIAGNSIWTTSDLRPLKAAWLSSMPAGKDVLVFGSSRAMLISEQWFAPRSMFNTAAPNGDLDDMIAYFQLCVESGKTPRAIVLELNPMLRHEYDDGDHRLLMPYRNRALQRYGSFSSLHYLMNLVSVRQFRLNLQRLRPPPWGILRKPIPLMSHVFPDGSAHYEVNQSRASPDASESEVAALIRRAEEGSVRWRTSSVPDPRDLALFRSFLDDVQSRGIAVMVLLPPIHPVAYEHYTKLGGYDETWIRREMAIRNIPVVGSYSPAICKAVSTDFFDDVHPHAEVIQRILVEAGHGPR